MPRVCVAVDTETTGLGPTAVVWQVGLAAISAETNDVIDHGSVAIKLTDQQVSDFSPEAKAVNGWTPAVQETAGDRPDAVLSIQEWLRPYEVLAYMAHNANFDRQMLAQSGMPLLGTWYCTLCGFRILTRTRRVEVPNHKLASLAKTAGYVQRVRHHAEDDVLACAAGWKFLLKNGISPSMMVV